MNNETQEAMNALQLLAQVAWVAKLDGQERENTNRALNYLKGWIEAHNKAPEQSKKA